MRPASRTATRGSNAICLKGFRLEECEVGVAEVSFHPSARRVSYDFIDMSESLNESGRAVAGSQALKAVSRPWLSPAVVASSRRSRTASVQRLV